MADQPHAGVSAEPIVTLVISKVARELEATVITYVDASMMSALAGAGTAKACTLTSPHGVRLRPGGGRWTDTAFEISATFTAV